MCGRYFLFQKGPELEEALGGIGVPDRYNPSYNIAPSQPVLIVPNTTDRIAWMVTWGLIPSWSKEPKMKYPTINARSETAHEKPSYHSPFKSRRCLIPASGFYEWMKVPGEKRKQPYAIQMEDQQPFAFAGLWEVWHPGDEDEHFTCTILTTQPNPLVAKIHDRMPVILKPQDYDLWLDPADKTNDELKHLFDPYPAADMATYPVSKDVGSPANNHSSLLEPIQLP